METLSWSTTQILDHVSVSLCDTQFHLGATFVTNVLAFIPFCIHKSSNTYFLLGDIVIKSKAYLIFLFLFFSNCSSINFSPFLTVKLKIWQILRIWNYKPPKSRWSGLGNCLMITADRCVVKYKIMNFSFTIKVFNNIHQNIKNNYSIR